MYYVIESKYVGPNQDQAQYCDVDTIGIYTTPGKTNMSREVKLEGWLGTTNDWSEYAHGEYETVEAAEAAIRAKWEHVRDTTPGGDSFLSVAQYPDDECVALFKPGQYDQMSSEATGDWCYEGLQTDITADTTDARIAELAKEYEAAANSEGYTLDSNITRFMENRRQELRDERDELEADEDE